MGKVELELSEIDGLERAMWSKRLRWALLDTVYVCNLGQLWEVVALERILGEKLGEIELSWIQEET